MKRYRRYKYDPAYAYTENGTLIWVGSEERQARGAVRAKARQRALSRLAKNHLEEYNQMYQEEIKRLT